MKSLTPEEVNERIHYFGEQHGQLFEQFEDYFLKRGRPKEVLSEYLEWADLVDAYRGYEEGGELDYVVEEIVEFDSDQLEKLTPKRMELLDYLASTRVDSINELAHRIRRDVKNVYEDLRISEKLHLLNLKKRGKRNIVPQTSVEEITLLIR